jgi:hypothetical protein
MGDEHVDDAGERTGQPPFPFREPCLSGTVAVGAAHHPEVPLREGENVIRFGEQSCGDDPVECQASELFSGEALVEGAS